MEEIIPDFFDHLPTIPSIEYAAVFDQNTGKILSVGPVSAFLDEEFQISIDKELAHDILSGSVNIHDCFVDFYENSVTVKQVASLYKIDDVLHRITERRFFSDTDAEVFLSYDKNTKILEIELTDRFCGTRASADATSRKQPMIWDGDTQLVFYVTGYNDPHKIFKIVTLAVSDLVGQKYSVKIKLPEKFSVFTRRLFKRYVIE